MRLNLIKATPCHDLGALNRPDIYLKLECEQFANSFKTRGIVYFLKKIGNVNGLVTFTTGNHGIALSAIAKELNVNAIVVSNDKLKDHKRHIIEKNGAKLIITEYSDLERCINFTKEIARINNYEFVPLFGDYDLLEGYSKITEEIISCIGGELSLYFPVGSGSLLYSNEKFLRLSGKDIEIIAVEPEQYQRLAPVKMNNRSSLSIADSLSITDIPAPNAGLVNIVNKVEVVSEKEIAAAMKLIHEYFNIIVEPGGAVALAAAIKTAPTERKKVAIITGKNIPLNTYEFIISKYIT